MDDRSAAPAWMFALTGFLFASALIELLARGPAEAALRARVPAGFLDEAPLDLATSAPRELRALPGIGAARALAIARSRFAEGPITSPAELERIHGIGPVTVERVRGALER